MSSTACWWLTRKDRSELSGATGPPELQAAKDQGEQPELDIAPIQLLHSQGLSGLPLDEQE